VSYFRSRRKGRVHVEMPGYSGLLIADLARQLVELLSDGEPLADRTRDPFEQLVDLDSPREPPTDPALLRLLPDGYRDEPDGAAEFRRFTELSLRRSKIGDAEVVVASIGDVDQDDPEATIEFELDADQARAWLRCLTDLRLTLAARLDVSADDEEMMWLSLPDDDPRGALYRIYGWLGYQLEMLLEAVQK
jgi:hypothetical protein